MEKLTINLGDGRVLHINPTDLEIQRQFMQKQEQKAFAYWGELLRAVDAQDIEALKKLFPES